MAKLGIAFFVLFLSVKSFSAEANFCLRTLNPKNPSVKLIVPTLIAGIRLAFSENLDRNADRLFEEAGDMTPEYQAHVKKKLVESIASEQAFAELQFVDAIPDIEKRWEVIIALYQNANHAMSTVQGRVEFAEKSITDFWNRWKHFRVRDLSK